jgi:DNA sulfur modification protein DndE
LRQLTLKRVRFSKEADSWLRTLKSRTGVTPNLMCRLGFCISLEEMSLVHPSAIPEDSDREINRYTLLGGLDDALVSLLRQRMSKDGSALDTLDEHFRAHMNRGVLLLAQRLKSLSEVSSLLGA